MMNDAKQRVAGAMLALTLVIAGVSFLRAGPAANINVTDADTIRTIQSATELSLFDRLAAVAARVSIQFADTVTRVTLAGQPPALEAGTDAVAKRVLFDSADTNQRWALQQFPAAMSAALEATQPRVQVDHADTARQVALNFPVALVDDNDRPVVTGVRTGTLPDGRLAFMWTTDEFADSLVEVGTQSGQYSEAFYDPLFVEEHVVIPAGLAQGARYYYRATSKDQSGNVTQSAELTFTFTQETRQYLPTVIR